MSTTFPFVLSADLDGIAKLIQALGAFAWPAAAVSIAFIFKTDIRRLLKRIKRGTLFGQEVLLDDDLDRLEETGAEGARASAPAPEKPADTDTSDERKRARQQLYDDAARSPKVALMAVSADLDRELRQLSAVTGWARGKRSSRQIVHAIPEGLPERLKLAIDGFWDVRNKIVHGAPATDSEALRALDIGLELLDAVRRIPIERHYVLDTNVALFADARLTQKRDDVCGVRLRSVNAAGDTTRVQVFPTTRDHFVVDEQVAWDWNPERQWEKTWYHDPDSQEPAVAWDASFEFVGRLLRDV